MNATDYSYSVGSNSAGAGSGVKLFGTGGTFGFGNNGQVANDLKGIGAIGGIVGGFMAADALSGAADTTLSIGQRNKEVYYRKADVTDANASYAMWKGKYQAFMTQQEAEINRRLADSNYAEQQRAADVMLQSASSTLSLARAKKGEYDTEAGQIWSAATTQNLRSFQNAKTVLGQEKVATAESGFTMGGTELARIVSNASRLEQGRMDALKTALEEVRKTKFAGDMALYEGETTAWQQTENARALTFTADTNKFKADVEYFSANQQAQIYLLEAKMNRWNLKQQAADLRLQGDIAFEEAQARAASLESQGESSFLGGIMSAVGTIASIL